MDNRSFRFKFEIVSDTELAHEANSILIDIVEYAQTASILSEFRDTFGKEAGDYHENLTTGCSKAVISSIICSMENSSIVCLGRIFDKHDKSVRLRSIINKFPDTMRTSQLGVGLAIIFLKEVHQDFGDNDPVEKYREMMMDKIIEVETTYKNQGFCSLRNSYVGHANWKKRDENARTLIDMDRTSYLLLAERLLEIGFCIKHCLNPIRA